MSRAEKMILAGTAAIVLLILILDAIAPREPNWNTSFTRYKTDPYACGLTYDRLGDLFSARRYHRAGTHLFHG